ncbi:hypothetical protein FRC08_008290 [Ceratobasidium sp. 394]|nr:hypothetical protein FRC08_008290 [Ceratobasidium sp. 394]
MEVEHLVKNELRLLEELCIFRPHFLVQVDGKGYPAVSYSDWQPYYDLISILRNKQRGLSAEDRGNAPLIPVWPMLSSSFDSKQFTVAATLFADNVTRFLAYCLCKEPVVAQSEQEPSPPQAIEIEGVKLCLVDCTASSEHSLQAKKWSSSSLSTVPLDKPLPPSHPVSVVSRTSSRQPVVMEHRLPSRSTSSTSSNQEDVTVQAMAPPVEIRPRTPSRTSTRSSRSIVPLPSVPSASPLTHEAPSVPSASPLAPDDIITTYSTWTPLRSSTSSPGTTNSPRRRVASPTAPSRERTINITDVFPQDSLVERFKNLRPMDRSPAAPALPSAPVSALGLEGMNQERNLSLSPISVPPGAFQHSPPPREDKSITPVDTTQADKDTHDHLVDLEKAEPWEGGDVYEFDTESRTMFKIIQDPSEIMMNPGKVIQVTSPSLMGTTTRTLWTPTTSKLKGDVMKSFATRTETHDTTAQAGPSNWQERFSGVRDRHGQYIRPAQSPPAASSTERKPYVEQRRFHNPFSTGLEDEFTRIPENSVLYDRTLPSPRQPVLLRPPANPLENLGGKQRKKPRPSATNQAGHLKQSTGERTGLADIIGETAPMSTTQHLFDCLRTNLLIEFQVLVTPITGQHT